MIEEEQKFINGIRLSISNSTSLDKVVQLPRFLDLFATDNWCGDNIFKRDGVSIKADIGDLSYKEFLVEFQTFGVGYVFLEGCLSKLTVYDIDFLNKIKFDLPFILSPYNLPQGRIVQPFVVSKNTTIEFILSAGYSCTLTFFPNFA